MAGYGQFCPVAKAMEILDERWTLLIVRELLMGSRHFNELRRGVPRMSPALLSTRLRSLERNGVLTRIDEGGRPAYQLTACGSDLLDVVNGLGRWGLTWATELGDEDLDPQLLLWDIRRSIPVAAWPGDRTTVALSFRDVPGRGAHWWVVVAGGEADICDVDPGFPVAITVTTSLRALTRIWRGELAWARAIRTGVVDLHGPAAVRRRVPGWFGQSLLARAARASGAP